MYFNKYIIYRRNSSEEKVIPHFLFIGGILYYIQEDLNLPMNDPKMPRLKISIACKFLIHNGCFKSFDWPFNVSCKLVI